MVRSSMVRKIFWKHLGIIIPDPTSDPSSNVYNEVSQGLGLAAKRIL